jgi:hypothetical protein
MATITIKIAHKDNTITTHYVTYPKNWHPTTALIKYVSNIPTAVAAKFADHHSAYIWTNRKETHSLQMDNTW